MMRCPFLAQNILLVVSCLPSRSKCTLDTRDSMAVDSLVLLLLLFVIVQSYSPLSSHGARLQNLVVNLEREGEEPPYSPNELHKQRFRAYITSITSVATSFYAGKLGNAVAEDLYNDDEIVTYRDQKTGFSLGLYPGWKEKNTISPIRYKENSPYNVVFVASNLAEGCSLIVNDISARALLKDADVDWWFADLTILRDLGSPELLADLLIKQRKRQLQTDSNPYQGPKSVEEKRFNDYQGGMDEGYSIVDALFNDAEQSLQFSYTTSIGKYINEVGYVKGFYVKSSERMRLVWISALGSVFDGDYGETLKKIRNSFRLL